MNFLTATMQLPLHDIVDEHHVSWWPLAFGWWLVLAVVVLSLVLLTLWGRRAQQHRRRARSVEALLQAPANSISDVNLRLKQVLLLKYPRAQLANLNAEAWQQRLAAELPEQKRDAFSEQLAPYIDLQYQSHTQAMVEAYQAVAMDWWAMVRPHFVKGRRHV